MATLATILDHIRGNIIDVPTATENRLIGWVNEAQVEAQASHNWLGLAGKWAPSTLPGSNIIARPEDPTVYKPDDWLVADGNPFWRSGDGGATHEMEWAATTLVYRKDYPSVAQTGSPKYLFEFSNRIHVFPASDENNVIGDFSDAGEYTIVITYRMSAEQLIYPAANGFFTNDANLVLFLEDYATGQAMLFNRDIENAQIYLLKSRQHLLRAKRLDKLGKGQSIRFTPRRDVYASRRQRRAY